jgi:HSP20 family protein
MLMRFDPFRDLDRLTQNLWNGDVGRRMNGMPIDAYRQGERFYVLFDVPGVDPASVELTVEKNVLTVTADRPRRWGDDVEVLVNERPAGTFSRQLFLGDTLDADNIEASSENGVLTVTIPVAEKAKPRKVAIAQGDGGSRPTPIEANATS